MCRGQRLEGVASGYWTLSVKQSRGRQPLGFESLALRSPSAKSNALEIECA